MNHNVSISDGLIIAYLSFIAYVLEMAKEVAYLTTFGIPLAYLNTSIASHTASFLIAVFALAFIFFYNEMLVNNVVKYVIRWQRKRTRKKGKYKLSGLSKFIILFTKPFFIIGLPLIFYNSVSPSLLNTLFYFLVCMMIICLISILRRRLLRLYGRKNARIISLGFMNCTWFISSFICFWSAGLDNSIHSTSYLSIDNGKTAVIHTTSDKIFTKAIFNGRLSSELSFNMITIKDTTYKFTTVKLEK